MKHKQFNQKLALNKKTIVNLNQKELGNVLGGFRRTAALFCATLVEGCDTSTCHESRILYSCDCGSIATTLYPFQGC